MNDELKLGVFSACIFGAAFGLSYVFELPLSLLLLLTFFFGAFSLFLNLLLRKALKDENKNKFTQVFMGITGAKMFGSLILLAIVLFLSKGNKLHTGMCIMMFYMAYTVFEVVLWRSKLKS